MGDKFEKFLITMWTKTPLWLVFIGNFILMMILGSLIQSQGGIDKGDFIFNTILSGFYAFVMWFFAKTERSRKKNQQESKEVSTKTEQEEETLDV